MRSATSIANLPDWAETSFQLECDRAGFVRNKALHDRSGWDFLVEFERPRLAGVAHDLQPGPATARVQVKSKRGGSPRCTIKLSNALRFCREPDPCFVVLYRMSNVEQAVEVFAREFDEELMASTLRRARKADHDGATDLNRIIVPIAFEPTHRREDDLLDWLRERAGIDGSVYAARKAKLNRTLGRETVAMRGTFTVDWQNMQALIEHSVGMGPPVNVRSVRLEDVRFGIPAREPLANGPPASFHFRAEPRRATLIMTAASGRKAVFSGEIRSFNMPGLPASYHRARFTSDCISFDMSGDEDFTLSYSLSQQERRSIGELLNELSFVIAAGSELAVKLEIDGVGDLDLGKVDVPIGGVGWATWMEQALQALRSLGANERLQLSFDDLGLCQDAVDRLLYALADATMTVEMVLLGDARLVATIRNVAYFVRFDAGDASFEMIVRRPCLSAEIVEGVMSARFGKPVVVESIVRVGGGGAETTPLRDRFIEMVSQLGTGVLTLDDGEFTGARGRGAELTLTSGEVSASC